MKPGVYYSAWMDVIILIHLNPLFGKVISYEHDCLNEIIYNLQTFTYIGEYE